MVVVRLLDGVHHRVEGHPLVVEEYELALTRDHAGRVLEELSARAKRAALHLSQCLETIPLAHRLSKPLPEDGGAVAGVRRVGFEKRTKAGVEDSTRIPSIQVVQVGARVERDVVVGEDGAKVPHVLGVVASLGRRMDDVPQTSADVRDDAFRDVARLDSLPLLEFDYRGAVSSRTVLPSQHDVEAAGAEGKLHLEHDSGRLKVM